MTASLLVNDRGRSRKSATYPATSPASWPSQWIPLGLALIVLSAALLVRSRESGQLEIPGLHLALPSLCPMRNWLGIPCAGCGLSRAFVCLVRGNFAGAWQLNPASPLVFAIVAGQIPWRLLQLRQLWLNRPLFVCLPWSTIAMIALLVTLHAQWILRLRGL